MRAGARRLRAALARARRRRPAAGDGPDSSPAAADASEEPSPLSFADAPVTPLLHHPSRRPRRRRDAVASTARSRRLRPPARLRDLLAAAARQAGQRSRRAGDPRGAERDRRPGDGDAGRPPRRHLARERPLRRDRTGADPVQGPQRPRHGPGDDPRGGRRPAARRHRPLVAAAPPAGLSLPDQVARRAAGTWRSHPRPRVRDEGRLQRRPRPGRPRRQLRGAVRRVRPDLRAARARDRRRRVRCRDHGRQPGPRVHGPQPGRRGRPRAVRIGPLRRQPPGRGHAQARGRDAAEDAAAARRGRHARDDDDRHARGVPRDRRRSGRPRPPSS